MKFTGVKETLLEDKKSDLFFKLNFLKGGKTRHVIYLHIFLFLASVDEVKHT